MFMHSLKSTILIIFLFSFYLPAMAQFRQGNTQANAQANAPGDFEGSWVLIHAQRIDGSRIVERNRYITKFEYTFSKNNIIQIDSIDYAQSTVQYNLNVIDATHAKRYDTDLELISDTLLVITERYDELSLDKKNKFVYLKKDRYLKYLKSTPYFIVGKDSTIVANGHIFPSHEFKTGKSTLSHWIYERISPCVGQVTGYFIVDKNKNIIDVQLVESRKFDKWESLVTAFKATSGEWELPIEGYNYKVQFTLGLTQDGNDIDITYKAKDFEWFTKDHLGLSGAQIRAMASLFERGSKYLETNNFKKAIADFTTCIAIDPLYLDAYYNRAYSNFQMKQTKNACKDWRFLKDIEQVNGRQLFEQNCKK
jgi:tetratricopeptide (TPR) repeat protein